MMLLDACQYQEMQYIKHFMYKKYLMNNDILYVKKIKISTYVNCIMYNIIVIYLLKIFNK